MADYERFDALRDAAREHKAQGNTDAVAHDLAEALAAARAGFAAEPDLWYPRLGMVQMDIERSAVPQQLSVESELATRETIAYARAGAGEDPVRRDLFVRTANAFSMQLEAEERNEESLALAEELLELQQKNPERRSELAHTRQRTAQLRLINGDPAGALELADALVDEERTNGQRPSEGASGLPSWLRLRARAAAALGRVTDARADFDESLEWARARVRAGRFVLPDLDLADALEEHAAFLDAIGSAEEARSASEEARLIREERRRG